MRMLVTGCAGFIGSWISDYLRCNEVIGIDDLSGGFENNLKGLSELYEGSVTDHRLVKGIFKTHKPDVVIHTAAYAAEVLSHHIKRFNYENNVIGSVNLINESVNYKVNRFVFLSSAAVYGDCKRPHTEDMVPQPIDSYGIAKLTVEKELEITRRRFGLPYTIYRLHNVFGARQNMWDRQRNVIGIFMRQAINKEPLTIFGDGKQKRQFSYIAPMAAWITNNVMSAYTFNETLNIGSDKSYTINEIADLVVKCFPKTKRKHLPARYEEKAVISSHEKIKKLGYKAKDNIDMGIRAMAWWAVNQKDKMVKEPRREILC